MFFLSLVFEQKTASHIWITLAIPLSSQCVSKSYFYHEQVLILCEIHSHLTDSPNSQAPSLMSPGGFSLFFFTLSSY